MVLLPLVTSAQGDATFLFPYAVSASGRRFVAQAGYFDTAASSGIALTPGLEVIAP